MKKISFCLFFLLASSILRAQVGIGTITPKAFFNVADENDVLFGPDVIGGGTKLLWYGTKGAFRVGHITGSQWNIASVGLNSFATGYNTIASGECSTALSYSAVAYGDYSTAIGYQSKAINDHTTAIGYKATAGGTQNGFVTGVYATAIGYQAVATGYVSMALGADATASGELSTAMGTRVSTNTKTGAFIIGDSNPFVYASSAADQMMMRFEGGYMLYTTAPQNQSTAVGVKVISGGNAWQTISDSTRKENFRSADGAAFLQKISTMRLGSWNYKGQNVKQYRHYGPMAQDFFAAFGHDELGTIGEDKSINQADFDGVNLIAIQALIQKIEKLEAENGALKQETASLRSDIESIKRLLTTEAKLTFKP